MTGEPACTNLNADRRAEQNGQERHLVAFDRRKSEIDEQSPAQRTGRSLRCRGKATANSHRRIPRDDRILGNVLGND